MNRRTILAGLGSTFAAGGILSSGAFTSVNAERNIAIDVAGDANAFLRLAPCTLDGEKQPNGSYVHGHTDGTISIDLSDDNPNNPPAGRGVNTEALTVFDNVFEICNQGTQPVCVDFAVDVPVIPNGADVPDRYDFEDGDLAVVFYRGDDRSDKINVDDLDTDRPGAFPLDVGECQCVGFEVRAFGFDTGEDLFEDAQLEIVAEAGSACLGEEGGEPLPELEKTWADSVGEYTPGNKKNGDDVDGDRDDPEDALDEPDDEFVSLGFGGELTVEFDEEDALVRRGLDTDTCLVETTRGRDSYPEETALVEVSGPNTDGYVEVGEATNKASGGTNTFEIPSEPIDKIRITDMTDPSIHNGSADGFDVDAVGGYTVADGS